MFKGNANIELHVSTFVYNLSALSGEQFVKTLAMQLIIIASKVERI